MSSINKKTTFVDHNKNLDSTTTTGNHEIDLLERAKIAYRQTMPEILGGGYPVQAGIIRGENEHSTRIAEEPATKPIVGQIKDQFGLEVKHPVEAGIIKDGSGNISSTEQSKSHGQERLHELEDELWKAPVSHSTRPELTQEGIKEIFKLAPSTDHHQSSIKSDEGAKAHLEQAKDEMKMAFTTAKPHLEQAASHVREAGSQTMTQVKEAVIEGIAQIKGTVSKEERAPIQAEDTDKTMIQEAKHKIKETVQEAKNKINDVSSEEKPHLKQTSPVKEKPHLEQTSSIKGKLEAGVEKAKEKLEERKEENLKQKPVLEQAKIRYRETMPEVLGGRPSSVPEVLGMVKKYEDYADHQKEEAKNFEQLPPEEQSGLAKLKHNYKETMPVVLGGRPTPLHEVVEGAVKNKVDNVKKDTQEEVDNMKESYENGNLGEHLKELYKDKMPESLGGRTPAPPTFGEKVKAEVQKEVGEVEKAVVKNRVNAVLSGTKEQIAHTLG